MSDLFEELRQTALGCNLCKLAATRTKVVFGEGNPRARLMFIGEAPAKTKIPQVAPSSAVPASF